MKPKETAKPMTNLITHQNVQYDRDAMKRVVASLPVPESSEFSSSAKAVWCVLRDAKPRIKRRREK